jgi:hypothetical protein
MPELRAVLVLVPPLLAGLVRQVLAGRPPAVRVVAELGDAHNLAAELARLDVDVALLGAAVPRALVRAALAPGSRILSLSADLTELTGPGDDARRPFTSDNLVRILSEIRSDLDLASPPQS